jgi:hypothetical protein
MPKFLVIKPWREGQKVGDLVELTKLHACLVAHVQPFHVDQKTFEVATPSVEQESESDGRSRKKREME